MTLIRPTALIPGPQGIQGPIGPIGPSGGGACINVGAAPYSADPGGNVFTDSAFDAALQASRLARVPLYVPPGRYKRATELLLQGGDVILTDINAYTRLVFRPSAPIEACILPRDPTVGTDTVRIGRLGIEGDPTTPTNTPVAIKLASCRKWSIDEVEINGSDNFSDYGILGYGQRYKDGTTTGAGTVSVQVKATLSADIGALSTSAVASANASQYQDSGILKIATLTTATLATAIGRLDTTVTLSSIPTGMPASGAIVLASASSPAPSNSETLFYTGIVGNTLVGVTRASAPPGTHSVGEKVYIAELVRYSSITGNTFNITQRGIHGTSAFAHTAGAWFVQNPSDTTYNYLNNPSVLSGNSCLVKFTGTPGTLRINGGQTNMTLWLHGRVSSSDTSHATQDGIWVEQGADNVFVRTSGVQIGRDIFRFSWFGNMMIAPVVENAPAGRGVHFTAEDEAHDNMIIGLHDGSGVGTVPDDLITDDNGSNSWTGSSLGWRVPNPERFNGTLTKVLKGTLYRRNDGWLAYRDGVNGDTVRIPQGPLTLGGRTAAAAANAATTVDAILVPSSGKVLVWQSFAAADTASPGPTVLGDLYNATDAVSSNPGSFAGVASATGGTLATGSVQYRVAAMKSTGPNPTGVAPSGTITVAVNGPTGSVALSWTAAGGSPDNYRVYRSTDAGTTWTYQDVGNVLAFTDVGVAGTATTLPVYNNTGSIYTFGGVLNQTVQQGMPLQRFTNVASKRLQVRTINLSASTQNTVTKLIVSLAS